MKTREKVIKEAWGEYYLQVKDNLKQNGGIHPIYLDNESGSLLDCIDMYQVSVVEWRPKSLQGIENNNGWIKVNNIEEFPKHLMECFVFDDDGDISYFTFGLNTNQDKVLIENGITHYQPIVKPKPPLY